MFCSWGAEEFGLVGSVEWVEENSKLLSDRAIAYLNTDVAVGGNHVLVVQTCPLLVNFIFSWAKKIRDPNAHGSRTSMYDIMCDRMPSATNVGEPYVIPFKYMSDYYPFYMDSGVPSADFSYFFGFKNSMELYPVYHTQQDTFYWVKKFVDPNFEFHEAMAKFQGGMLLDLADLSLLPYDVKRVADTLKVAIKTHYFQDYKDKKYYTDHIVNAVYKFGNVSEEFLKAKSKLTDKESSLVYRRFNDQMVQVEKAFIRADMYSRDPINKHVLHDTLFLGVQAAFSKSLNGGSTDDVNKQLSIVAEAISSAADILKPMESTAKALIANIVVNAFAVATSVFSIFYFI